MVKPERRTRADLIAAAAIAVVVALVAALIWWTSDARATISRPAASPVKTLTPAKVVPASLRELWTAPSPKTRTPVLAGGSVVTGDGHQVDGRDPRRGRCCGATPATSTCAGSPRCTTTRSPSIPTAAAAVR